MYEHDQYALPDSSAQSVIVPLSAALFSQGCNSPSDPIQRAQPSSPRDDSPSSCNTSCTSGASSYCHVLDPVIQSVHQQPQQHQLMQRRKSDSDAATSSRPSCSSISSILSPLSNHSSEPVSPNSIINRVSEVSLREDGYASGVTGPSSELSSNFSNGSPLNCSSVSVLSTTDSEALQSDKEWNDSRSVRRGRPKLSTTPVYSPCMICGDRSTGKHYGAFSCDGCKGFFRRSIRKNQMYTCRFTRECNVTKDRRNQCRHCRLRKCVNAGMKKEAVQNERDRISHRRLGGGEMPPSPAADGGLSVDMLMDAENHCRQTAPTEQRLDSERQIASVNDVAQSVKQQLLVLVEWAKAIPSFAALKLEDRIKLLKAHSGEHLLLGIAWRSRNTDGYLLLGNDKLIPRLASGANVPHGRFATAAELSVSNINWIASRVLDDIVRPLLTLSVDEKEFMCLRTMIFFDPMLHGLEDPNAIHTIRLQAQLLLEDYIADRQDVSPRSRFGQIMFMLPYLQTISTAMIHQIQVTKMDGFTEVDTLISEMLLGSLHDEEKEFYHNVAVSPILSPIPLHRPIIIRTDPAYSRHQDCPVRHATYGEPCDLSYHHNHHHHHDNSTHHHNDNNTHHHERHQQPCSPTRIYLPDSVNSVINFSDEPLMEEMSPSRRNSQGSSIDEKCSSLQPGTSDYRVVVLGSRSPQSEQDGEMETSDYSEVVNHLNLSRRAEHSYSDTVEQSIKLGLSSRPNHTGNLNSSEPPGRYESVNRGRILLSSSTTSDYFFEEMASEPYDLSPGDHSPYSAYGASRSSGGRSQGVQQQPLNLQQVPD